MAAIGGDDDDLAIRRRASRIYALSWRFPRAYATTPRLPSLSSTRSPRADGSIASRVLGRLGMATAPLDERSMMRA